MAPRHFSICVCGWFHVGRLRSIASRKTERFSMIVPPNKTLQRTPKAFASRRGGGPSRLQSPRLLAAVAELGSLGRFTRTGMTRALSW